MEDKTTRDWYGDLFKISSELVGTIRCTYLWLYDEAGNFLFSLSPRPVDIQVNHYYKALNKDAEGNSTSKIVEIRSDGTPVVQMETWAEMTKSGSVIKNTTGVVKAVEFVDEKLVPVKLEKVTKDFILQTINNSVNYYRTKYLKNHAENATPAEVKFMRWLDIVKPMVESDANFYVNRWQCRWYPLNDNNLNRTKNSIRTEYKEDNVKADLATLASVISLFI